MSAAANTLPGQNITGIEGQDIDTLVKAEVERLWADQKTQLNTQGANVPQGGQAAPIKLNVFGQEFSFNDPASASAAVEQALTQVREQVAAQALAVQQRQPELPTKLPDTAKFDKAKFADIVSEDPLKGIDYALGHLLYDGKTDGAASTLKAQLGAAAQQRQVLAAYQFRERFPHFAPDQQSVAALDQIRQGLNLSADNAESWEAAYALGVSRGIFQPPPIKTPTPQPQPTNQPPVYIPPTFGRSTGAEPTPDWLQKANDMPTADLEKLLTRYGQ